MASPQPFRFWLNDDIDLPNVYETNVEDDDNPANYSGNLDFNSDTIRCVRDLEDHARIWLTIGGLQSAIANGTIAVGLKWVPFGNATLLIGNCFFWGRGIKGVGVEGEGQKRGQNVEVRMRNGAK
jgi:hypothetical protein